MSKGEINLSEAKSSQPASDKSYLELRPLSHDRFQASWSLNHEAAERGQVASSSGDTEAHLVLRVFFMGAGAELDSQSHDWCDYSISEIQSQDEFDLPKSPLRINAALGFVGQSKRFSPLVGAEAVDLPALPEHAPKSSPAEKDSIDTQQKTNTSTGALPLSDSEIATRVAQLVGLPKDLKSRLSEQSGADEEAFSREQTILDLVLRKLAEDPFPSELAAKAELDLSSTDRFAPRSGSPIPNEDPINHWESLWSGRAPIEIRAEFVLYGKIATGLGLMLGHEIVEADSGGRFIWRKKLEAFDQVWPLLRLALEVPTLQAGPSLEFFKDADPESRLLEIHGKLELSGMVGDPEYIPLLPDQIQIQENGQFSFSRLLPEGAIILPGISLIAK